MTLKTIRVELVEDWQDFYKWSSVRFSAAFAALLLLAHPILSMLQYLPLLSDHYPEVIPYLMHLFPKTDQSLWTALGALLTIAARITSIRREPR